MFRCLECGEAFRFPLEVEEAHGEKWYLCPHCKENRYKPFVRDEVSRREVLERAVGALAKLNRFREAVESAFNSCALDNTDFDFATSDMHELIVLAAGDAEFDLSEDITGKLFDMKTEGDAQKVFELLTKNIE